VLASAPDACCWLRLGSLFSFCVERVPDTDVRVGVVFVDADPVPLAASVRSSPQGLARYAGVCRADAEHRVVGVRWVVSCG